MATHAARGLALLACGCADPVNTPPGAALSPDPANPTPAERDFFAGAAFVGLSSGADHACAIRTDGALVCHGDDDGDGLLDPPAGAWRAVAAGDVQSCAIAAATGEIRCWGYDQHDRAVPPTGAVAELVLGDLANCARREDGAVVCWGDPALNPTPEVAFSHIDVGYEHACGLRAREASVVCWGRAERGALHVPAGAFRDVAAGRWVSCGVELTGTLRCWGDDRAGAASPPAGDDFRSVEGWSSTFCALRADGSVACWGQHDWAPTGAFVEISVGPHHGCGREAGGQVRCWGDRSGWR